MNQMRPPGSFPPNPNQSAPQGFQPHGSGGAMLAPKSAGMAKASMILGLVSLPLVFFCIGWITAIVAIILGCVSFSTIAKGGGRIGGKGLAWTGIISAVVSLVGYGIFVAWIAEEEKNRPQNEKDAEEAVRTVEGMLSGSAGTSAGRGETELEKKIAEAFVDSFKTLHGALIVYEDAAAGTEAPVKGKFTAVCDIKEDGCVILAKVPKYKDHDEGAKDTVAEVAWLAANSALEEHADEVPPGTTLLVGLKGLALYGAIMTGEVGDEEPTSRGTEKSIIEDFYLIEDDAAMDEEP